MWIGHLTLFKIWMEIQINLCRQLFKAWYPNTLLYLLLYLDLCAACAHETQWVLRGFAQNWFFWRNLRQTTYKKRQFTKIIKLHFF